MVNWLAAVIIGSILTMRWNDESHFRVRVASQAVVVEAVSMRLAAA